MGRPTIEKAFSLFLLVSVAWCGAAQDFDGTEGAADSAYSNPAPIEGENPSFEAVPEPEVELPLTSAEESVQDPAPAEPAEAVEPVEERVMTPEESAKMDAIHGIRAGEEPTPQTGDGLPDVPYAASETLRRLIKAFAWLCVLCALIIFGGYAARRWGKSTPILAGTHYGTLLGKVHLSHRAALYYVKTGDRVLVVGLTQNDIRLISDFPLDAFESMEIEAAEEDVSSPESLSFLEEMRKQSLDIEEPPTEADELADLRGDVQRLQRHLQESLRDPDE
jgi:flagellar biogenesis protein FliO